MKDVLSPMTPVTDPFDTIPQLFDSTGRLSPEFAKFYTEVRYAVANQNYAALYALSDLSLSEEQFVQHISSVYDPFFKQFYHVPKASRGLDIELNLDSLKTIYRNLINSIYILTYMIESTESDMLDTTSYATAKYHTELHFTYKDGRFCIISAFLPFIKDEDDKN